jgi:septum formation protein
VFVPQDVRVTAGSGKTNVKIVLASASATRQALLTAAGVEFAVKPAPIDERAVEAPLVAAGAKPDAIAAALADAKAASVSQAARDALVIGADQVLDFNGERWTKPASRDEARAQLRRLAGKSHRLATAVTVARGGTVRWRHLEAAHLTMRSLTGGEIDDYLGRVGEAALTGLGAYQIEGLGIQLFDAIDGDYFAILGLPLLPLLAYLRREGAVALAGRTR